MMFFVPVEGYLHCLGCKEGYVGRMCQHCDNGYYRAHRTSGSVCTKCIGCHNVGQGLICEPSTGRYQVDMFHLPTVIDSTALQLVPVYNKAACDLLTMSGWLITNSLFEPNQEKWGFRPGSTQIELYSYRRWLEA